MKRLIQKFRNIYNKRGAIHMIFCPFDLVINHSIKKIFGDKILLFLSSVDTFQRYKFINQQLETDNENQFSILDVGGGNSKLSLFLNKKVYVLDNHFKELGPTQNNLNICGEGCKLPFRNNTFDFVTSVACLEHIPKNQRKAYLTEIKRVCSKKVVLYTPLGETAKYYDSKLLKIKKKLLINDKWTEEHLFLGHPEEELLFKEDFTKIKSLQNANIWLIFMTLQSVPIIGRIFPGILYSLILNFFNKKEPYIGGIFIHNKTNL